MFMCYSFLVRGLYINHVLNGNRMQIQRKAFKVDEEDNESY